MSKDALKILDSDQISLLIEILQKRFLLNMYRHRNCDWEDICRRLLSQPEKLYAVNQMEQTGGEPDVVKLETNNDKIFFIDCSIESPAGRRSLCYDREALDARKENKPIGSAWNMATEMGIEILNEMDYRNLQSLGDFDTKTSSWLDTPDKIRKLGGALFGDKRYDHVFIYHNGVQSYYAARGFRGKVEL